MIQQKLGLKRSLLSLYFKICRNLMNDEMFNKKGLGTSFAKNPLSELLQDAKPLRIHVPSLPQWFYHAMCAYSNVVEVDIPYSSSPCKLSWNFVIGPTKCLPEGDWFSFYEKISNLLKLMLWSEFELWAKYMKWLHTSISYCANINQPNTWNQDFMDVL